MTIESIYVLSTGQFAIFLQKWSEQLNIEFTRLDSRQELSELIDAVVLVHENHNVQKDMEEIIVELDKSNRPAHRIDINGTLAATKSNFEMWFDRNRPKKLLFIGKDELTQSENLDRFFNSLLAEKKA